MTSVTIKDIPVMQELSDDAARKIVGGRWSEQDEKATTGSPTLGGGAASMSQAWWIDSVGGVGHSGVYGTV